VDASAADQRREDTSLRFPGSAGSLEELGSRVLTALAAADTQALAGLRLTEHEHNRVVWPELPASRPEVSFPLDYAWTNIELRNASSLARILPMFAERQPAFERVECRGPTERFRTFEVLTDCWVVFADADAPDLLEIQAFKDVLVRGGGFKVFRYYDEEPRRYGRT
jgi:hypothetical protein